MHHPPEPPERQRGLAPPQDLVARGYDRIGSRYAEWAAQQASGQLERHVNLLLGSLPAGSRVLDLGCGSGRALKPLSERFRVTGVDISRQQLALAKRTAPEAELILADMTCLRQPAARFGAVTAFYSITHVPRQLHADLFRSIARWLAPGGIFVASLGGRDDPGSVEAHWLGVEMYFSHWNEAENRRLIRDAGLAVQHHTLEVSYEDGAAVEFLWVTAIKPGR